MICISAEAVFELIIPLIMADIIDIGVKNGDKPFIFIRGGIMVVCAVAALILGIGSAKFAAKCGNGLGAELRKEEYRKLQGNIMDKDTKGRPRNGLLTTNKG